jgi:serine/threonine protein kinase
VALAAHASLGGESDVLRGKPAYASPEQLEGGDMDCRSDIYSLGVTLWTALTGQRLFSEEIGPNAVAERSQPIQAPSSVAPQVPSCLDAVCLKALAPAREDRYQSAEEMLSHLRRTAVVHDLIAAPRTVGKWVAARRAPEEPTLEHSQDLHQDNDGVRRDMSRTLVLTHRKKPLLQSLGPQASPNRPSGSLAPLPLDLRALVREHWPKVALPLLLALLLVWAFVNGTRTVAQPGQLPPQAPPNVAPADPKHPSAAPANPATDEAPGASANDLESPAALDNAPTPGTTETPPPPSE